MPSFHLISMPIFVSFTSDYAGRSLLPDTPGAAITPLFDYMVMPASLAAIFTALPSSWLMFSPPIFYVL